VVHKVGYGAQHNDAGGPTCILTCYCDQITMQWNECYDCVKNKLGEDGIALDLDLGTRNSVMQYNYGHDCDSCGFYVYESDTGNTVRWNLSVGNCKSQPFAGEISLVDGKNAQVYNNTAIGTNANGINISGDRTGFDYNPPMLIVNNACYVSPSSQAVLRVDDWTNVTVSGNSYWDGDGTCNFRYGSSGTIVAGLAAFRSATGLETGSGIESDPKFNNPTMTAYTLGNVDLIAKDQHFTLKGGSPLRFAGEDMLGFYIVNPGTMDLSKNVLVVPYEVGAFGSVLVSLGREVKSRFGMRIGLGL
jgi:hypothetical protein